VRQVPGVSSKTQTAIRRIEWEAPWLSPGETAEALIRYREFVYQPERLDPGLCPACPGCDPLYGRDVLEQVLHLLPPRAMADLQRVMAPLDHTFERRTVHDPFIGRVSEWAAERWWRQRFLEL
jgi:hypothetical protein